MIRIRSTSEVRFVARVAVRRRGHVIVVRMALCALHGRVHPGERPMRIHRVIELGVQPIRSGMAGGALVRQSKLHVRRVLAVVKVCRMATETRRRRARKHIIDMAARARKCGVRTGKRESGLLQVIEFGIQPAICRVAVFARRRESRRNVVQNRRSEIFLMT